MSICRRDCRILCTGGGKLLISHLFLFFSLFSLWEIPDYALALVEASWGLSPSDQ